MTEPTTAGDSANGSAILRVRNLRKHFPLRAGLFGRSKQTVGCACAHAR